MAILQEIQEKLNERNQDLRKQEELRSGRKDKNNETNKTAYRYAVFWVCIGGCTSFRDDKKGGFKMACFNNYAFEN